MSNPNQDLDRPPRRLELPDLRRAVQSAPGGAQAVTTRLEEQSCTIPDGWIERLPKSRPSLPRSERAQSCEGCGGAGYYLLAVPYTHPDFGKLQRCNCESYRQQIAAHTARLGDELGALSSKTFESFQLDRPIAPTVWQGKQMSSEAQRVFMANAHKRCQAWALAPVAWLYIHGAFGAGKSHLAAAIANAQQQSGKVVRFVTVNKLLDTLRAGIDSGTSDRMISDLIACDLLILDELAGAQLAECASDWRFGRIDRLINERLEKPTIITSNLAADDLAQPGDIRAERLADRIAGAAQVVWMPIASYRRIEKAAQL
jgi:DNA replication protein DnaC